MELRLANQLFTRRSSGRRCQMIDFGAVPFGDSVRAVRSSGAIVGVHGAGLTNAIFMQPGANRPGEMRDAARRPPVMVEVLPRAFSKHAFGLIKFGFLPALGVRHARVTAPEADPGCVGRARGLAEKLRDCDVKVEWRGIEKAIAGG